MTVPPSTLTQASVPASAFSRRIRRVAFSVAPSRRVNVLVERWPLPPRDSVSVSSSVPSPDTVASEMPPQGLIVKRAVCPTPATRVMFVPPLWWYTAVPARPTNRASLGPNLNRPPVCRNPPKLFVLAAT